MFFLSSGGNAKPCYRKPAGLMSQLGSFFHNAFLDDIIVRILMGC